MKHIKLLWTAALTFFIVLGINSLAHALPCDYGFVDGAQSGLEYDCKDATGNDSAAVLNAGDGFFDITNWVLLDKSDNGDITPFDPELEVTSTDGNLSGTWSFKNSPWGMYSDILLIIKGGPIFSAYKAISGDVSGEWAIGAGTPSLSHMSVYGGRTSVPEPATVLLLGSGLFGAAVFRKKR